MNPQTDDNELRELLVEIERKLAQVHQHEQLIRQWQQLHQHNLQNFLAAIEVTAPVLQQQMRDKMTLHEYIASLYGTAALPHSASLQNSKTKNLAPEATKEDKSTSSEPNMVRDVDLHRRLAKLFAPSDSVFCSIDDGTAATEILKPILQHYDHIAASLGHHDPNSCSPVVNPLLTFTAESLPEPVTARYKYICSQWRPESLALMLLSRLMTDWLLAPCQQPEQARRKDGDGGKENHKSVAESKGKARDAPDAPKTTLPRGPSDVKQQQELPLGPQQRRALALTILHFLVVCFPQEVVKQHILRPVFRLTVVDLYNIADDGSTVDTDHLDLLNQKQNCGGLFNRFNVQTWAALAQALAQTIEQIAMLK